MLHSVRVIVLGSRLQAVRQTRYCGSAFKRRGAIVGNYPQYSGLNQDLFTLNQCIAAGAKMTIWFIGGPMSRDTYEWSDNNDLVRIAAEVRTMYRELMLIGHPLAFYSTPVTKTHDNKPLDKPAVPRWFKPLPADLWVQVTGGEAMVGVFKYPDGTDALFIANHNAFAPQEMSLKRKRPPQPLLQVGLDCQG